MYGGDIYTPKEEVIEQREDLMSDDEDDITHKDVKSKVRSEDVFREMLKTSYGRDKAFVSSAYSILQYCTQVHVENYTILFTTVSPRAYHSEELTLAQAVHTAVVGTRNGETT